MTVWEQDSLNKPWAPRSALQDGLGAAGCGLWSANHRHQPRGPYGDADESGKLGVLVTPESTAGETKGCCPLCNILKTPHFFSEISPARLSAQDPATVNRSSASSPNCFLWLADPEDSDPAGLTPTPLRALPSLHLHFRFSHIFFAPFPGPSAPTLCTPNT